MTNCINVQDDLCMYEESVFSKLFEIINACFIIITTFLQGSLINDIPEKQQTKEAATLSVLRLTKDEVGCRPVAVAGSFPSVTAQAVTKAPKVSSEGVFATFSIPAEGLSTRWVPLPAWSIIALASRPVALEIKNCADFKPLREASGAKTEDDIKRLQGPGILVIDAEVSVDSANVDPSSYYAVAKGDDSIVQIMAGGQIDADDSKVQILGPVLFLCRPPVKDLVGSTSSELLSL